jgi:hypothetical protein
VTEFITVTPGGGYDHDGNPRPPGASHTLAAYDIAPGNTARVFGDRGELVLADFTVYLPLRSAGQDTQNLIADGDRVLVRGRECIAQVRLWKSGGRGGLAVLCKSATGGTGGRR